MLLWEKQRPTKTRDKVGKAQRQGAKARDKVGKRQRRRRATHLPRRPASTLQNNAPTSSLLVLPPSPWAPTTSLDFHQLLHLPEGLSCHQFRQLQGFQKNRSWTGSRWKITISTVFLWQQEPLRMTREAVARHDGREMSGYLSPPSRPLSPGGVETWETFEPKIPVSRDFWAKDSSIKRLLSQRWGKILVSSPRGGVHKVISKSPQTR